MTALDLSAPPRLKRQTLATLDLLRARGSLGLTRLEAIHEGIGNLPARVLELRRAGYRIASLDERTSLGGRYARYFVEVTQ
jgi:hypothetical protein